MPSTSPVATTGKGCRKHHSVLGDQSSLSADKGSPELWSTTKWCDSSDNLLLTQISSCTAGSRLLCFIKRGKKIIPSSQYSKFPWQTAGEAEAHPAVTSECSKPGMLWSKKFILYNANISSYMILSEKVLVSLESLAVPPALLSSPKYSRKEAKY